MEVYRFNPYYSTHEYTMNDVLFLACSASVWYVIANFVMWLVDCKHETEIEDYQKQIEDLSADLEVLQEECSDKEKLIEILKERLTEMDNKITILENDMEETRSLFKVD